MGKIVLTQGSFDVFHQGHANFLRRCRNLGDELHIGVITDDSYKNYRGYLPKDSLEKRIENIKSFDRWAYVFPTVPQQMLKDIIKINPDTIAIGSDWIKKPLYAQWGVNSGAIDDRLVYIPYTPYISSTQIKNEKKT